MLIVHYSGWTSCRLPTDPDPYDDPRGNLSNFRQLAYAGEPDLDRRIWFNDPPYVRTHTDPIGVTVRQVTRAGTLVAGHPLEGAPVDLLDGAVLEGRNHVVAQDGTEPIYPFNLRVGRPGAAVSRARLPTDPSYPFPEFVPIPGGVSPVVVLAAVGRTSHFGVWTARLTALEAELTAADEEAAPGLEERIAMLRAEATAKGFLANQLIRFSMRWRNELNGPVVGDVGTVLGVAVAPETPWTADLWFGGFDADAQAFFCSGTLEVPEAGERVVSLGPGRRRLA